MTARTSFVDLSGISVFVTGASSGLGAHFARTLVAAGAEVWLGARRTDRIAQLCEELAEVGGKAHAVEMDVRDGASIRAAIDRATSLDVLVNNAGVSDMCAALDVDEESYDRVLDTNARGAFLVAQAAGRRMRETGGAIINVASVLGLRQAGHVVPYAMSKAAVIQMTKSLALEWARYNIRVNAIAPGYISTELNDDLWETDAGKRLVGRIPQRRTGRPEELDGGLLLLASPLSTYMTGAVVAVDGGHLVSTL